LRYALLLLVLLLACPVAHAELPRHTPNFPESSDLGSLQIALKDQLADLVAALSGTAMNYQDLLSELVNQGVVSPEEANELSRIASRPLSEVINASGSNVPPEVVKLLSSGKLSPEELSSVAELLVGLKKSGALDPYSFLALSRLVLDAAKSLGTTVPSEFSTELIRTISEVLDNLRSHRQELQAGVSVGERPGGQPGLPGVASLPKLSALPPSFPSMSIAVVLSSGNLVALLTVLALLVALTAVVLIARSERARSIIRSLLPSRLVGLRGGLSEGDVVSIYWSSVRLLERATRVLKADYVTHREYLGDVISRDLRVRDREELVESFRELTELYEACRFGFGAGDRAVERARNAYAKLVRSVG